mmetsp:Transcript_947/g.3245  ORF Transcript_947/g.3245 Transcript_947/m.3245 type:complete len:305 (-) Transcript_947:104-1018(-)|eukprot:CAMPEP_0117439948 /NCGR_PEP_ID=MMETSP0759-20121206/2824_1 /TAXON_ID=63605 /ORGANISM="Percolomonas cosmopolitus, Strain WS" /LENGTH=304 /DNA_ID=CAMNT_0005231671 /DNA_START=12 /DNA_END=926 /DNA_ORIENTATION=+
MSSTSPPQLSFKNKVIIITGAARGLGLQYCHEFAKRGAKLVINDLDTSRNGVREAKSVPLAVKVASELSEKYGIETLADTHSVLDADKVVSAAVERFGTVHVLINNAGILRDRSFGNMSQEEWDKIYEVHVQGVFRMTRAVWPLMKQQNYGRVIFASSAAGIYGSYGQANYSACKSALIGMARTLAIEGKKSNILLNVIAPLAATRMSEGVIPGIEHFDPSRIAPLVVYLSHESLQESGSVLETAGGWVGKLRWERSPGRVCSTPEEIASRWNEITDFSSGGSSHPASGSQSFMEIAQKLRSLM